jgi:alkylation response protein AidB-like acyl-CoA dehydrogenase
MRTPVYLHPLFADGVSAEARRFLHEVAQFAHEEVEPHAAQWDKEEHLPREIFHRCGQLGLMGVCAPKHLGGRGQGLVVYAHAIAELAAACAALALDVAAHNALVVGQLVQFGSEEQQRRCVPKLAAGEWIGAWALTEPGAGSDSGGMQTKAVRKKGQWEVTGEKLYITSGRRADLLVVMATTGTTAKGRREISAFLVDKQHTVPVRKVHTCGMRASETSELRFERAPAELLGTRGTGQAQALAVLERGRIGVAAVSVGLMRAALAAAGRQAHTRQQFGRPIAEFQAVAFKLADAAVQLDAAELLTLRAATLQDRGQSTARESAIAKLFASEAATRVCSDAVQIHGGSGYSRDLPLERHWRDARLCEIGEGTSEIQRLVISRQVLAQFAPA